VVTEIHLDGCKALREPDKGKERQMMPGNENTFSTEGITRLLDGTDRCRPGAGKDGATSLVSSELGNGGSFFPEHAMTARPAM
jgi:hypothetical protein